MSGHDSHRLHPADRRRCAAHRGRQGLCRAEGLDVDAGARSVVVQRARQAQSWPVRRGASVGAGRDRLQPRDRPYQDADGGAGHARRSTATQSRHRPHCIAGSWRNSTATRPIRSRPRARCIVSLRRATGSGSEPVTFGMTFPYSTHNYQLRFWMAAGGIDPDEDVRLVVLPPPYMVDSLASGQVDGFCVGAPWNAVAVARGIGRILHFGPDILKRAAEKVLAVRRPWAQDQPDVLAALVPRAPQGRLVHRGRRQSRRGLARFWREPDRVDADAEIIRAVLAGRLTIGAGRPDPQQRRLSCFSVGMAPTGPIRRRQPGSTRRWCVGGRRAFGRGPCDREGGVPRRPLRQRCGAWNLHSGFAQNRRLRRPGTERRRCCRLSRGVGRHVVRG